MALTCPLCYTQIQESEYLRHVFPDDGYAYWVACAITHYRHDHIQYYDNSWKVPAYAEKNPEYADGHEAFKAKVNNRAKRQLIRAIVKSRFKDQDKINLIKAFVRMQNNDKETMALRRKMLDKLRHKTNKDYWNNYQPKEYELVKESELEAIAGREFEKAVDGYRQATLYDARC